MATDVLVDRLLQDGRRYLDALKNAHFDVTAAFWVRSGDDDRWRLYIASRTVDQKRTSAAYSEALAVFQSIEELGFDVSDVRLVATDDPIAREFIQFRDSFSKTNISIHVGPYAFATLPAQEAWVYGANY